MSIQMDDGFEVRAEGGEVYLLLGRHRVALLRRASEGDADGRKYVVQMDVLPPGG